MVYVLDIDGMLPGIHFDIEWIFSTGQFPWCGWALVQCNCHHVNLGWASRLKYQKVVFSVYSHIFNYFCVSERNNLYWAQHNYTWSYDSIMKFVDRRLRIQVLVRTLNAQYLVHQKICSWESCFSVYLKESKCRMLGQHKYYIYVNTTHCHTWY